jgi:hypothetical protein
MYSNVANQNDEFTVVYRFLVSVVPFLPTA